MARPSPYKFGTPGFVGPPSPDDYQKLMAAQAATPQGPIAAPNSYLPAPGPYARPAMIDPAQVPNVAGTGPGTPGYRADYTRTANDGSKFGYARKMIRTPEEARLIQEEAMGADDIPVALNPDGSPMSHVDPNTGEEVPVRDFSKIHYNPEHPYQVEKKGLGELQAALANYAENKKMGVDLSPLMALADSQNKNSHLAEAYHAPNNEGTINKILSYQDEIQKRRADMGKVFQGEIGPLNGAGTFTNMEQMAMVDKFLSGQHTPRPATVVNTGQKATDTWAGKAMGDSQLKDISKAAQGAGNAWGLLDAHGQVQDSNFRFALLRALGVGRLTNYELMQEQGGKAFWTKLEQGFNSLENGTLTDENRKGYMEMIQNLAQEITREQSKRLNEWDSAGQIMGVPTEHRSKLLKALAGGEAHSVVDSAKKKGLGTPGGADAAAAAAKAKQIDDLKNQMKEVGDIIKKAKAQ